MNARMILVGELGLGSSISDKFRPPKNYVKFFNPPEDGSKSDDTYTEKKETIDGQLAQTLNLVTSNYIIVRQIMQNMKWQDVKLASSVSKLWNEAAKNQYKSDLTPQHFCLNHQNEEKFISYKIDKEPNNEPMLILAFLGRKAMLKEFPLAYYSDCDHPDDTFKRHRMLDYVYINLSYPLNALVGVTCDEVIYPAVKSGLSETRGKEFMGGLYFPHVNGVRIHKLHQMIESNVTSNEMLSISNNLSEIMETERIKCLLIFPSKYFRSSHDNIIKNIIAKVKARQGKEYPFAVGGCMVYGTQFGNFHEPAGCRVLNVIAIGVDKKIPNSSLNFDVFSKVIALKKDSKDKITDNISEMSELIPRREYSAAVKLSCVGRTDSHDFEETVFTKHFPGTKTVGCFGMGEIGLEHLPQKVSSDNTKDDDTDAGKEKKPRLDIPQKHKLFYEYSSIMVFFSWGLFGTISIGKLEVGKIDTPIREISIRRTMSSPISDAN